MLTETTDLAAAAAALNGRRLENDLKWVVLDGHLMLEGSSVPTTKVDTTQLKEALDLVLNLSNADGRYTRDSWTALDQARTAAQLNLKEADVDLGQNVEINLTQTEFTMDVGQTLSAESWKVLESAKLQAGKTLRKADATADELTAANTQLKQAMDALVPNTDPDITVNFTLMGRELHGTADLVWIAPHDVTVPAGSMVKDIFEKAMTEAGLTWEYQFNDNYVAAITSPDGYSLAQHDNGPNSGWMYTLNGIHVSLGLAEQPVAQGDVIYWHYINDYMLETVEGARSILEGTIAQADLLKKVNYTAETWKVFAEAKTHGRQECCAGRAPGCQ